MILWPFALYGMETLFVDKLKNYLEINGKGGSQLSVYIDNPFCPSVCHYCIYNSLLFNKYQAKEYEEALIHRIEAYAPLFEMNQIDTLYFGGGTPNLLSYDTLRIIRDILPNYNSINIIKTEAHPALLNDERMLFYSNVMGVNNISLGVQSLHEESCKIQNRVFANAERIADIVKMAKCNGMKTNIDLVALFGGDDDFFWEVFRNDIDLTCSLIKPDVITSVPNYRTQLNYSEQLFAFRTILAEACSKYNYLPPHPDILSLDENKIIAYGKNDHWIGTKAFWEYNRTHHRYNCSGPKLGVKNNQITIAFGGAERHRVYSYLPNGEIVYSYFCFSSGQFVEESK